MNLLSIIMDGDRNLSPKSFFLGVERDHKIDKLVLVTDEFYGEASLSQASVSLHLKAESGYTYNQLCDEKVIENGVVYFIFPVTREMTCVSGSVRVEFFFDNPSVPFSFTTRSTELIVAKPLTDTAEVESDYPGILSDVLTEVSGFSNRLSTADSLIETLNSEIGVLLEKQNENTLSIKNFEAFFGYNDEEILGLEADFENSSFTRLAGAKGLDAGADFDGFSMYQRRRCNVADDGTILAYYGDENYRDDGTNGQVMVYQPKFYYRIVPTKLEKQEGGVGYHIRKANYYISAKPKPFFKLHPAFYDVNGKGVEYILYSAYEGSMYNVSEGEYTRDGSSVEHIIEDGDLLCSVAGVKPVGSYSKGLNKINLEKLAQTRGENWHLETIKAYSANLLLMVIEFASFNLQKAIGKGVVSFPSTMGANYSSITGSTAFLGNSTGVATETVNEQNGVEMVHSTNGKVSISYRGIENVWGNLFKHLNGINYWNKKATMRGGQVYIARDFAFDESKRDSNYEAVGFYLPAEYGHLSAFGYGNPDFDWLFIPSEATGSSAYPIGDQSFALKSLDGQYSLVFGGAWSYDTSAGPFCFFPGASVGYGNVHMGGRLIFVPSAK